MSPGTGEGGGVGANQAQIGLKLASADYHGALFEVVRSRCPSRVGIKGICVKETKSMFYIITESSGMKGLFPVFCWSPLEIWPNKSDRGAEGTYRIPVSTASEKSSWQCYS